MNKESDNLDVKLEQQKTLKDKLVLEQEKFNQHFETAKLQLELKFAEEKKELEEKVARGEMKRNELQRQKEDVEQREQRMLVGLQEFRVEEELRLRQMQEELIAVAQSLNAMMKEAIRKTEHRRRTHEDRILRVQKELDEKLLNEIKCLICSELMEFATVLNCGHTFCQHCVREWKKNKVECPICRAPITTEQRNPLVDDLIDIWFSSLSEETKNRRKEIIIKRR
ncbi:E3 ubiquitin-protein ligase RNF8-like isoform X2 [Daphnia pulicaria]|uniref:E3 ubiquitin-protein ligase RNF8-like isoform X2 n=1 Tax=Daphnia pulicaria TaxID=35523 RepID=UPI001EEB6931|nr:E3 ubiquitin-protein ligase RNF8-like isoform X2 [Daphnia pulicaria]